MKAFLVSMLTAWSLATADRALGAEPCRLVAGSDQPVTVALAVGDPEGTLVAGATIEVDHPEAKVGIEGEGIHVPPSTIGAKPADAIATANDLGGAVRVVIARAGPLPTNAALFTLHFERCAGAPAVAAADFSCKVTDASDPSSNKIHDVGCRITEP